MDFLHFLGLKYRKQLLTALFVLALLIIFEACQQYFYLKQYELVPVEDLSFSRVLFGQLYRWLVWFMITVCYFGMVIYQGKVKTILNPNKPHIYFGQIIGLIFINLSLISLIQVWLNQDSLSGLSEYLVFYFFQKTPIYLLAYMAVMALIQLAQTNRQLELEVIGLEKLAGKQKTLYQELIQSVPKEELQVLSIKVGNKNKVISLKDVNWIEANDYCVKIHTDQNRTYAMRNSLKTLSIQLAKNNFLRVHRRALVNMKKVKEMKTGEKPLIRLYNDQEIEIAKSRVKEVKVFFRQKMDGKNGRQLMTER